MSDLKACPKCESTFIRLNYLTGDGHIKDSPIRLKCFDCGYAEDYWSETYEDAIKQWNTRPLEDALRVQFENAKTDYALLSDDYKQYEISLERKDSKINQLQQEADEWHKMAIRLAEQLEYPDGLYGLTHCDNTTLQSYRDLSQRYPNVPGETASTVGTSSSQDVEKFIESQYEKFDEEGKEIE